MIYRPRTSMDVDDATAIEMIANARNRLAFARRNDTGTPDVAYAHLIEGLDSMLDLSSEDFSILEWHARAFQADERFEQALRLGRGAEFNALIAGLRDVVARARFVTPR